MKPIVKVLLRKEIKATHVNLFNVAFYNGGVEKFRMHRDQVVHDFMKLCCYQGLKGGISDYSKISLIINFKTIATKGGNYMVNYEKLDAFLREKQIHSVAGYDHCIRVHDICLKLADKMSEEIDYDVLRVAAYLHDIAVPEKGTPNHNENAASVIGNLLYYIGLPEEKHQRVLDAIRTHTRHSKLIPQTLEAEILKDADGIDGVGAVGLLRAVIKNYLRGSYDGDINKHGTEFIYNQLEFVKGTYTTKEGSQMADERIAFLKEFIGRLENELNSLSRKTI